MFRISRLLPFDSQSLHRQRFQVRREGETFSFAFTPCLVSLANFSFKLDYYHFLGIAMIGGIGDMKEGKWIWV